MRIGIAGAGSIGCYVGGMLAAGGHEVALLGRASICTVIGEVGLHLSDTEGLSRTARGMLCGTGARVLEGCDVVLVCVKSRDTEAIARQIAPRLASGAVILSLQNGIGNAEVLRSALPGHDVRAGMVPFNVVSDRPGHFHKATDGIIALEQGPGDLARALAVPGLAWHEEADMQAVLWGKLLVNLNNALNALSGLPLKAQLMNRNWRRLLAAQMTETLAVLKRAGIRPARFTAAPAAITPHILRLPTPVFRRIAAAMLTIDETARSSMQDDLRAGKPTEIDALQGEVLRLARAQGRTCPTIEKVAAAIRAAEEANAGPPGLRPGDLM